jgi:FlaA1/EpsC-like NDP-sugar epimerase
MPLIRFPRWLTRFQLALSADLLAAVLSLPASLVLTDPRLIATAPFGVVLGAGLGFALIALVPLLVLKVSRQSWRYFGLPDALRIAVAAMLACTVYAGISLAAGGWHPLSPMAPAVQAIVLALLWIFPRATWRSMRARAEGDTADVVSQPVLLAGAGDGADLFLRALGRDQRAPFEVLGLLTVDPKSVGQLIHGKPILGTMEDAPDVLAKLRADGRLPSQLVVTSPAVGGLTLSRLLDVADREGVGVKRLPRLTALDPAARRARDRGESVDRRLDLRPIAIEDLLNRAPVDLDREAMARLVAGKRVLVTGAGGTIGSELARQISGFGPEQLTLLDVSEYAAYEIDLAIGETHPTLARKTVLADIRDRDRIGRIIAETRPQLVFHAAALKHVPLVEDNPLEGIATNAVGTRNVADACRANDVEVMVLISTDKAVNPASVMGATKRLAEMYCQALDLKRGPAAGSRTRFVTVRFGNVLGSTGSVVPLFRRQLERGGPLTVTHPDMQRYFMTVAEAVSLVLAASALAHEDGLPPPAQAGGIVVLDMGKPVRIVDLARQMVRLAGLRPEIDIEIRFSGLRPGEKLEEELFHGREPHVPAGRPGLLVAAPRTADVAFVARALDDLAGACRAGNVVAALAQLGVLIPEFSRALGTPAPPPAVLRAEET